MPTQAHTSDGIGWYLQKILITGREGKIEFPCHAWLGKDDAGDFNGERPFEDFPNFKPNWPPLRQLLPVLWRQSIYE